MRCCYTTFTFAFTTLHYCQRDVTTPFVYYDLLLPVVIAVPHLRRRLPTPLLDAFPPRMPPYAFACTGRFIPCPRWCCPTFNPVTCLPHPHYVITVDARNPHTHGLTPVAAHTARCGCRLNLPGTTRGTFTRWDPTVPILTLLVNVPRLPGSHSHLLPCCVYSVLDNTLPADLRTSRFHTPIYMINVQLFYSVVLPLFAPHVPPTTLPPITLHVDHLTDTAHSLQLVTVTHALHAL